MRIILDNIIFSLQKAGGISGAWAILVRELLGRPDLDIMFLEREDASRNLFRAGLHIPASRIITPKRLPLLADRYMPVRLGGDAPFIFHSSYYRTCASPLARNVVTLHDFIYEEAGTHPLPARKVHSWQKNRALRHAAAVIAVSDTTRRKLYDRFPAVRAEVIPNPAVCVPASDATPPVDGDAGYVLFVGGRDTYKNFPAAVQAVAEAGLTLHIAGAPLTPAEQKLVGDCLPDSRVEVTVYPDTPTLSRLYSQALCLLYPSSQEGFGIPVIEAQAHNCPVIIGPCPACMETAAGAALITEDYTPGAIARALDTLTKDPARRQALNKAAGRNQLRYQPARIARAHLRLYQILLATP